MELVQSQRYQNIKIEINKSGKNDSKWKFKNYNPDGGYTILAASTLPSPA